MEKKLFILFLIILVLSIGCTNINTDNTTQLIQASEDAKVNQTLDTEIVFNLTNNSNQNDIYINYSPQIFENCTNESDSDTCIWRILKNYDSIQVCDVLTERNRDYCYKTFNEINIGYGQCEKINSTLFRDQCYNSYANKTNLTACYEIINYGKDSCLQDVAVGTNNLTICDMIEGDYFTFCYSHVAEKQKNVTICDILINKTNDANLGACYSYVATEMNDVSVCKLLGNKSDDKYTIDSETYCIQLFAFDTSNETVCKLIVDSDERGKCNTMANNPNYFTTY